tara:strand:+ start:1327 stop:1626 length:300 start_codon:yes stop_codon:yes gene_type:complete
MTYPMPTNLTTVTLVMDYANAVTDGFLGAALLLALYLVILINLIIKGGYVADAMLVAGWITIVPSIIFLLMGLITGYHMFVVVAMTLIPLIWSFASKSD